MKQLWTKWGEVLRNHPEEIPLPEYPRPSLVRKGWLCLNGQWEYAIRKETGAAKMRTSAGLECREKPKKEETWEKDVFPQIMDGTIRVPFSPECMLSGVMRQLLPGELLWYRRSFDFFGPESGRRVLLHFGAVDQSAKVWVNGHFAGGHLGGYLPFTLEIGEFLKSGKNELAVCVQDDSDTSCHARGKQKLRRGGMFYTATSGIWQSIWLEEVPEHYIDRIETRQEADGRGVRITVHANGNLPVALTIRKPALWDVEYLRQPDDLEKLQKEALFEIFGTANEEIRVRIPQPERWSPEKPWLYGLTATLGEGKEEEADVAESYFAVRRFTSEKYGDGPRRLFLNHQEEFLRGVLDQGYWSDGLYTAPSDEALIFDIARTKRLGFNMIRKHLKIEPERWYYYCDRLGMTVWQDMVCGGGPIRSWFVTYAATFFQQLPIRISDAHPHLFSRTNAEGREEFEREMVETILLLKNHPCICSWVIFNEGWGQFETKRLTALARKADPEHLIDAASGWFDQGCGDFQSIHHYYLRLNFDRKDERIRVLSEFGGLPYAAPGHICADKSYGYGRAHTEKELQEGYERLVREAGNLQKEGFCGYVYTQLSDVEEEINGIFTFDRRVQKIKEKQSASGKT